MSSPPECFNCGKTTDVRSYSFDLDLPTITGCQICILALGSNDEELLRRMRPRRTRVRRRP